MRRINEFDDFIEKVEKEGMKLCFFSANQTIKLNNIHGNVS